MSRVERGRAGTVRRQDITDDVEGDRPDHAGTVVELGCARYDPIKRVFSGAGPNLFAIKLRDQRFLETVIQGRRRTQMCAFGLRLSPDEV